MSRHLANAYEKRGVHSRREATRRGLEESWVTVRDILWNRTEVEQDQEQRQREATVKSALEVEEVPKPPRARRQIPLRKWHRIRRQGPSTKGEPVSGEKAWSGVLPNLIIIGAMKCGTTALHRYLDLHPDVAMSESKELNFFCGPERPGDTQDGRASWLAGNWHRGLEWYAAQFRPAPVRGEASPGYTSPSFPGAAERMAQVLPEARLVYAVRDPVDRAVSQYLHHRADGTERRPIEEALLDPRSQYLERSRYYARLEPYLARFPRKQIFICTQEDLLAKRRETVSELYRFAGVDDSFYSPEHDRRWHMSREAPPSLAAPVRRRVIAELWSDAARFQELVGRELSGWRL